MRKRSHSEIITFILRFKRNVCSWPYFPSWLYHGCISLAYKRFSVFLIPIKNKKVIFLYVLFNQGSEGQNGSPSHRTTLSESRLSIANNGDLPFFLKNTSNFFLCVLFVSSVFNGISPINSISRDNCNTMSYLLDLCCFHPENKFCNVD